MTGGGGDETSAPFRSVQVLFEECVEHGRSLLVFASHKVHLVRHSITVEASDLQATVSFVFWSEIVKRDFIHASLRIRRCVPMIHLAMEILRGLVQLGACRIVADEGIKRNARVFLVPAVDVQQSPITKVASNSTLGWPESVD